MTEFPNIEPPTARVVHDVPPVSDCKDPENHAEPYLKLVSGWFFTTRSMERQQGMAILVQEEWG